MPNQHDPLSGFGLKLTGHIVHQFLNPIAFILGTILIVLRLSACAPTYSEISQHQNTKYDKISTEEESSRATGSENGLLHYEEGFDHKLKSFEKDYSKIIENLPKSARFLVSDFSVSSIDLRARTRSNPDDVKAQKLMVADELRDAVVKGLVKNGYSVVDRSAWKEQQTELKISYSGMVDDDQMISVGKMVGATHLISGNIASVTSETVNPIPAKRHPRIFNTWKIKIIELERMLVVGMASVDFLMVE